MPAVAFTDHGTMFGALDFYQQANKAGVKPIIGCECYVAPRTLTDKTPLDKDGTRHLVLLARNQQGYRNLCKLATIGQLEGYYYKPRIDKTVLEAHADGIIALSACLKGDVPQHILANHMDAAEAAALFYQRIFGEGNFFLELQHNGIPAQETVNQGLVELSGKAFHSTGGHQRLPLPESTGCQGPRGALCIQTQKTMADADRFVFDSDQLYFKSPEEMQGYFAEYPGAIENTVAIAERCDIEFDTKPTISPSSMPPPAKPPTSCSTSRCVRATNGAWRSFVPKPPMWTNRSTRSVWNTS
jgi:DNA polymerase-3 subunit alpha